MTAERRRADLIAELSAAGSLDDAWRPAFEQVARHEFLPDTIWIVDRATGGRLRPLHRDDEPDGWLDRAYRDAPVDTQVDDGHPAADGTGWEVTSSASQPSIVAEMLAAADAQPGMRVLEVGTGTGWNAALLAHRVGAENVTTIEVDPGLAELARARLDAAGFAKITVITGDGAAGWADGRPYDRVIATVGATVTPYAWVAQTRPGGWVVVPLIDTFEPPGLAVLTVDEHGGAEGGLRDAYAFMGMRSERWARPDPDWISAPETTGTTELHPYRWSGDRAAAVAIGQRLAPGVHAHYTARTDTAGVMWLLDPTTRSWASVEVGGQPPYSVEQSGPRRLLDEVETALRWWQQQGGPAVADWRVTVDRNGQRVRLPPGGHV